MATQYVPATVDESQLEQIQHLENEMGTVLLAVSPKPTNYADLSKAQVERIQSMESKLGVVLVALD